MADVVYKIKEKYLTVKEASQKWNVAERTVRNYCALEKINGAFLKGKTWNIPFDAEIPNRINKKDDSPKSVLETLKFEKDSRIAGSLYHKVQIELTYNSNHIEGSKLSEEQTRYIFETNTIGVAKKALNVDDIVETSNHFRCIDMIIDGASLNLSENLIKNLHQTLKNGTSDSRKSWFAVGNYKKGYLTDTCLLRFHLLTKSYILYPTPLPTHSRSFRHLKNSLPISQFFACRF